jgi:hypothetical protein
MEILLAGRGYSPANLTIFARMRISSVDIAATIHFGYSRWKLTLTAGCWQRKFAAVSCLDPSTGGHSPGR